MEDAEARRALKIVLPNENPKSANYYWSGGRWGRRKSEADRVHTLMGLALDDQLPEGFEIYDCPVEIHFTVYFANLNLRQDWSNLMVKPYEDSLIGRVITDDNPNYVSSGRLASRLDRDNPRVELEVIPIEYNHEQ